MGAGRATPQRPLHGRPRALLAVFVGGAAGTLARYYAETRFGGPTGSWPWATFFVNVSGAFVLGLLLEALLRFGPDDCVRRQVRLLLGTGFCGAFTTYSTFALETAELVRAGRPTMAAAYAATAVAVGTVAALAGILLAAGRTGRDT